MPVFCDAIKTIRKETGGDVFIKSTTASPFVLAGHLMGISQLMISTIENRDFLNEVLALCSEVVLAYAMAQCEAGTHAVGFGAALASPDVISPKDYIELVQPHEGQIIRAIHEKGCKHVIHICGNTLPIISKMVEAGSDIIDLDQRVDIVEAKAAVGGRATLRGNLDPVGLLLEGTPEQVFAASRECIEKAKAGGRFILAPGCTVAYHTPPENIRALQRAVEEFGFY
jgi:MtaA/CmuA family methyltransferase